jgi:outer membrane protein OmpA-like peptidoglycan-associated protein
MRRVRVIILGASEFPRSASLNDGGSSFKEAYSSIKNALDKAIDVEIFSTLDLFDSEMSSADMDDEIQKYLEGGGSIENEFDRNLDFVLVFYIGHGGLRSQGTDYFLAIRSTREKNQYQTSIASEQLAKTLRTYARNCRKYVVLDACFAAAALHNFQGATDDVVKAQLLTTRWSENDVKLGGVVLLCAASKFKPAKYIQGGTMFSSALTECLAQGDADLPGYFSISDLFYSIRENIRRRHGDDGVLPEIHIPDQGAGRVELLPLFRNLACVDKENKFEQEDVLTSSNNQFLNKNNSQQEAVWQHPEKNEKAVNFFGLYVPGRFSTFALLSTLIFCMTASIYYVVFFKPHEIVEISPTDESFPELLSGGLLAKIEPPENSPQAHSPGPILKKDSIGGRSAIEVADSGKISNVEPADDGYDSIVYFDFDKTVLKAEAKEKLSEIFERAYAVRASAIIIQGYLNVASDDHRGTVEARTEAVRAYLTALGVEPRLIKISPDILKISMKNTAEGRARGRAVKVSLSLSGEERVMPRSLRITEFDGVGKADILSAAKVFDEKATLDKLTITGHSRVTNITDAESASLSKKIAEEAKGILISHGYEVEKVFAQGKGRDEPFGRDKSLRGEWSNQRVEIVFSGIDRVSKENYILRVTVRPSR